MIIDVHGHYTTAPAALGAWRDLQIAGLKDPSKAPSASSLKISDDEIRQMKPLLTMVGGRAVHARPPFADLAR